MLRFRPKLGSETSKEWRCFFCLHVRSGAILLGIWHLMLHLIALGFLAAVVRDPNLLDELERESAPVADLNDVGAALPTPLSNVDAHPRPYPETMKQSRDHTLIYHDVDVGALVTVCTLAVTIMLIYGAARGKPAHLLPFFCLQIFDFAITLLTATGYLCYLRSLPQLVGQSKRLPWRSELLQLSTPVLALVVFCVFLVSVLIKGYCINVVWRCYKYLTMRTLSLQNLTPFVISGEGVGVGVVAGAPYVPPAPDYSSLLPDYEEAVKQTPPPSYRAATLMASAEPAIVTPESPPAEPLPATATAPTPAANTVVMLPQPGTQARV